MPLVSVIIPTHNRCHLLPQAIQSVRDQTYQNFEVLVVDDGSVDATASVVNAIDDDRVRYCYQTNAGRAAARNRGLTLAQGEFVAFLDDDDTFLPNKLTDQLTEFGRRPELGLTAGGWLETDVDGQLIRRQHPTELSLDVSSWLISCPFIVHAPLLRRSWAKRAPPFDSESEPSEDWAYWLNLAHAGCPMAWGKSIVCVYRQHPANSLRSFPAQRPAILAAFERFFAWPDLSAELRAQKAGAFARAHLSRALRLVANDQMAGAEREVNQALTYRPDWRQESRAELMQLIGHAVQNTLLTDDPEALAQRTVAILPVEVQQTREFRQDLPIFLALNRFYKAYAAGHWQPVRRAFWRIVRSDPRFVLKPGTLRIVLRAYVHGYS